MRIDAPCAAGSGRVAGSSPTSGANFIDISPRYNIRRSNHQSYQLALQAVGGEEILNRQHLKPMAAKSGASFVLTLPASQVEAGDYMLTLRGYRQSGELEDVSQSLFRVEKK
jgi:hypothetical protein